jgi:hypothetical protein
MTLKELQELLSSGVPIQHLYYGEWKPVTVERISLTKYNIDMSEFLTVVVNDAGELIVYTFYPDDTIINFRAQPQA